MPAPRIVVDSNVLISAFGFKGKPDEVLRLARKGEVELYLSPLILEETRRILLGDKFSFDAVAIDEFLALLPYREVDSGPPRLRLSRDPKDNPVLECSEAAQANFLVTGDRDLLDLGRHGETLILRPDDFLRRRAEATLELATERFESGASTSMTKNGGDHIRQGRKKPRKEVTSKRRPRKP